MAIHLVRYRPSKAAPQTSINQPMQTPTSGMIYPPLDPRQGTGFLQETPGNNSAMRLMCMMALVTAIVLSVFVIATPNKTENRDGSFSYPSRDPQAIYLIFGFLVAAFAPKAIQKFAEKLPTYDPRLYAGQAANTVYSMLPPAGSALNTAAGAMMPAISAPLPLQLAPPPTNFTPPQPSAPQPSPAASRIQNLKDRGGL